MKRSKTQSRSWVLALAASGALMVGCQTYGAGRAGGCANGQCSLHNHPAQSLSPSPASSSYGGSFGPASGGSGTR